MRLPGNVSPGGKLDAACGTMSLRTLCAFARNGRLHDDVFRLNSVDDERPLLLVAVAKRRPAQLAYTFR